MDLGQFERRKVDHVELSLDSANQSAGASGLERITLVHEALPDINAEDIRLEIQSLGGARRTPFFIAGMTGGHAHAWSINTRLANLASERGWAMGVGSQRRELHDETVLQEQRAFRKAHPNLELFGNLGIAQIIRLTETGLDPLKRVLDGLQPSALCVHVNAMQEILQPEGTPQFKGWKKALSAVIQYVDLFKLPLILKETGCGFSESTFRSLAELDISAVDVSGLGGTHWGRIEGRRADIESPQRTAAETFAHWGVPTLDSVFHGIRSGFKGEIWASGGVRTGLDAAKLMAVGSRRVGFAQPALKAAMEGDASLNRWMDLIEFEFRVALFCTGSLTPDLLKGREGAKWNKD